VKILSPNTLDVAGRLIDTVSLAISPLVREPQSLIFTFHSVDLFAETSRDNDERAGHSYAVFEAFLRWLKTNIPVVPFIQVALGRSSDQGLSAALSFDDAHLNHYTNVYPLLRSLQLPATFFVPSGLMGRKNGMTRSMVREVALGGITIGSHSVSHRALTSLSQQEVRAELHNSKAELEELTGLECRELAYPYGLYDDTTIAIAESAGYSCAAGATLYEPRGERFAVPRTTIPNSTSHWLYRIAMNDAQAWRRRLGNIDWIHELVHGRLGYNRERHRIPSIIS
jgi:peptidoglycan/xylan/chitin deacetylase (PgdA/CDA1 family)